MYCGVILLCGGAVSSAAARALLLRPSDGYVSFAKEFQVALGSVIVGARFANANPSSVYPEISLAPGRAAERSAVVRLLQNVGETVTPGAVVVQWDEPVVATVGTYHVMIRMPFADIQNAARIGANEVSDMAGSFVMSASEGLVVPLLADLDVHLVMEIPSKVDNVGVKPPAPLSGNRPRLVVLASAHRDRGATVVLDLPFAAPTQIVVFDVRGREIRTLLASSLPAGSHRVEWDGHDSVGRRVARGMYYLRALVDGRTLVGNVVLR
jgi:hypothetical protein